MYCHISQDNGSHFLVSSVFLVKYGWKVSSGAMLIRLDKDVSNAIFLYIKLSWHVSVLQHKKYRFYFYRWCCFCSLLRDEWPLFWLDEHNTYIVHIKCLHVYVALCYSYTCYNFPSPNFICIRYPNVVIIVTEDVLAPKGVKPLANISAREQLDMPFNTVERVFLWLWTSWYHENDWGEISHQLKYQIVCYEELPTNRSS